MPGEDNLAQALSRLGERAFLHADDTSYDEVNHHGTGQAYPGGRNCSSALCSAVKSGEGTREHAGSFSGTLQCTEVERFRDGACRKAPPEPGMPS